MGVKPGAVLRCVGTDCPATVASIRRFVGSEAWLEQVIFSKCLDCMGGSRRLVRKCSQTGCALWPYRDRLSKEEANNGEEDAVG